MLCFCAFWRQETELVVLTELNCSWNFFQVNIVQPENKKRGRPPPKDEDDFQLTCNACKALWSCSKNQKNIQAIRAAGAVPILASLLVRGTDDVILPAMGIIQECASEVWRPGLIAMIHVDFCISEKLNCFILIEIMVNNRIIEGLRELKFSTMLFTISFGGNLDHNTF